MYIYIERERERETCSGQLRARRLLAARRLLLVTLHHMLSILHNNMYDNTLKLSVTLLYVTYTCAPGANAAPCHRPSYKRAEREREKHMYAYIHIYIYIYT